MKCNHWKNIIMHLIDLCITAQQSVTPLKKSKSEGRSIFYEAWQYYPFLPEVYSCVKKLYPSIEYLQQALNCSIQGKFGPINICDFLRQMESTPQTLLKVYLSSQIFTALHFNCIFFKFSNKKILFIAE